MNICPLHEYIFRKARQKTFRRQEDCFLRCRHIFCTVWYSFELSLVVELLQLIFKVGSFDVDDLLLNTVGGMLGFLVYFLAVRAWRGKHGNKTT